MFNFYYLRICIILQMLKLVLFILTSFLFLMADFRGSPVVCLSTLDSERYGQTSYEYVFRISSSETYFYSNRSVRGPDSSGWVLLEKVTVSLNPTAALCVCISFEVFPS